jgi:hypothetical protein
MKTVYTCLILSLFFLFSACKKDRNLFKKNDHPTPLSKNIIDKFNLEEVNTESVNNDKIIKFNNSEELESYLEKKNNYIRNNKSISVNTESTVILGFNNAVTVSSSNIGEHRFAKITIISPYWTNKQFPDGVIVFLTSSAPTQWELTASELFYNGSNFGSWQYSHLGGDANTTGGGRKVNFELKGLYTEIFSIGGVYSYTKNYSVDIDGHYYDGPMPVGVPRAVGTINYTQI